MTPSLFHLQQIYPSANNSMVDAFHHSSLDDLFDFGISESTNRLYFFLAQVGHESDGLTRLEEGLSYSAQRLAQVWPSRFPSISSAQPYARNPEGLANLVYANRMGNGPPESGDGFRFRGRGAIQITGRDAYRAVGKVIGIDLENQPDFASSPENILRVACGFWHWKRINAVCDTGDFIAVTRAINGGATGLNDRMEWLNKVRRVFGAIDRAAAMARIASSAPHAATIIQVQRALLAAGYREVGAADGLLGPRTRAAITSYRRDHGLPDRDDIDQTILAALEIDA